MTATVAYRLIGIAVLGIPLVAQPRLETMAPRGARAGGAVRLTLQGDRLGPMPRLLTEEGIAATPLSAKASAGEAVPASLEYLLEVDAGVAEGVYPLRLETDEGLSNALLFTVSKWPQVAEAESQPDAEGEQERNDFPETAQAIPVPVIVEGRLQGAERDVFAIRAQRGQRLVMEVAARRVGSAVDPYLELLDGSGRVVQRNGDGAGLGLDARMEYEVPADGEYYVSVRDERYSDQAQDFYRLKVGEFEFADSVFPLGWTRGSRVTAEFYGGALEDSRSGEIDLGSVPGNAPETWVQVPGTSSFLPFLLSDGDEELETSGSGMLRDGVVMNGRISASGETDSYRLAVEGGDQWAFELRSGELPGSSLYGVMTIASADEVLAIAGKHAGDPNPYIITTTGITATYPFVNLTVPPDVTEITVSVEDLLGRGGERFSYRLVARRQGPDFLLALNEPFVNIPVAGSAIVTVTAERRGYYGPIELYVADPPEGLEVSGGHIAPTSTLGNTLPRFEIGTLTLTAEPASKLGRVDLEIRGRAVEKGQEHLDRRATGPGVRVQVQGEAQPTVTAQWLGYGLPGRLNPEEPAFLAFETPRRIRLVRGGQGQVAEWKYAARKSGVTVKDKVSLPRNIGSLRLRTLGDPDAAEGGSFRMFTHERTSLGMVNFNLFSTVVHAGREWKIYSKALEVDVVDGYGLEEPGSGLALARGGSETWQGSIWRDPEFRRTVTVTALNLPPGVRCEPAELSEDNTDYALTCRSEASVDPGDYQVEIRAESVLSDEGTTPYIVDPVKSTLTIAN